MASKDNGKAENFVKTLFKAADKLRKNMDAAEYKNIVLGHIFSSTLLKLMKGEVRVRGFNE